MLRETIKGYTSPSIQNPQYQFEVMSLLRHGVITTYDIYDLIAALVALAILACVLHALP